METNRLNRLAGWAAPFLAVTLYALFWIVYIRYPVYHMNHVQGEDRLVEWITFYGFAGAGLLILLSLRWRRHMQKTGRWFVLGLGLFLVVCAGEEISWGQRLLGFATPEPLEEINEQKEFNLHNINQEFVHPKDIVLTAFKVYGILLPLLVYFGRKRLGPVLVLYASPLALLPAYLLPDVLSLIREPVSTWAAARMDQVNAAFVLEHQRALSEELQEMFWGICLAASAIVHYTRFRGLGVKKTL